MPIRCLLKGVSKRQHSSLAKAWSGDLQTDWQSGAGETCWNRDGGQTVSIEGSSILPLEGASDAFSGREHDSILYPAA